MTVFDDVKLVGVDHGADLLVDVEPEKRHELVVKRDCDFHILHSDLDVIDDRFHRRKPFGVDRARKRPVITLDIHGGAEDRVRAE